MATASCNCAGVAFWKCHSVSRVSAGLRTAKVPPPWASCPATISGKVRPTYASRTARKASRWRAATASS